MLHTTLKDTVLGLCLCILAFATVYAVYLLRVKIPAEAVIPPPQTFSSRTPKLRRNPPTPSPEQSTPPPCKAPLTVETAKITIPRVRLSDKSNGRVHAVYSMQLIWPDKEVCVLEKRFSDFDALRKKIKHALASKNGLPSLPRKTLRTKLNDCFLETRRRDLESFMRSLVLVPQVSSLECVQQFCGFA
ncbi:hypothetical protein LEN26_012293 [Aphanomyces euteiches]|nr:hypothetical protein LEN26_012293 [Aphanomyces euteiches]